MCLKVYFVLALFLDAVTSTPHNIPRYHGNSNPEAALHPKNEHDFQIRSEEAYLPRSLPSYMSPVPTAVHSDVNEDKLSQYSNLRDSRSPNYNDNEKEYSRTNEQLPNVAHSTRSYENPSSTLNGNEILSQLLRQNRPLINNVVESTALVEGRDIQNQINRQTLNQLPLNIKSEGSSNNYESLKIQSAPEQRIAFQLPVLPTDLNLNVYHPATPVRNFNIDREWLNIAKKEPKLPDFIAERLKHPVDFQRSQMNGPQVHKPMDSDVLDTEQQYNIRKILSEQRIQNVLSTIKQTKRYLVIHPNGTVEHVDELEPIAARHPNYVLLNAGHLENKPINGLSISKSNGQVPVSTLVPHSSTKPIASGSQLPKPLIKNNQAIVNVQTLSPETSTIVEATSPSRSSVPSELAVISESRIATDVPSSITLTPKLISESIEIDEIQQLQTSDKSKETEDESEIENSTASKTELGNCGDEETAKNTYVLVESSSVNPVTILNESVTKNYTSGVMPAEQEENTDNLPVVTENSSENNSDSTVNSTFYIENAADAKNDDENEIVETNENQQPETSEICLETEDEGDIENSTSLKTEPENSCVEVTNENTVEEVESLSVTPAAIMTESVTENDTPEVIRASENKQNTDTSPNVTKNSSQKDSNSTVQSTLNIENTTDTETHDVIESDSVGARQAGKPTVYYTSDPDFWTKITDGNDSNFIYFFQVKSSPRVEKDRQRTIYPNGTILEELTETVWDGEGEEPKVTKTSKLIHPDEL